MNAYSISMSGLIVLSTLVSGYNQTIIKGRITPAENWNPVLYLSYLKEFDDLFNGYDGMVIDSVELDSSGYFDFSPEVHQPGWYRLNIQPAGSAVMAGMYVGVPYENYIHLYLDTSASEIRIQASAAALHRSYQISGNHECRLGQTIRDLRLPLFTVLDRIEENFKDIDQLPEEAQRRAREAAFEMIEPAARNMQAQLRIFLDSVRDVNAGVLATQYYNLGDSYNLYVSYFDSLVQKWTVIDTSNHYLAGLREEVNRYLYSLPIGTEAPNISLPSPDGKLVQLYEVQAKLVLLDFWASWCGPCRSENKSTVLPLFEKYRNKGFTVYAVSFDTSKKQWTKTIQKDGYPWIHVSDLKTVGASEVSSIYRIKNVPTTYLLDEQKRIIAKDLRGYQLIEFVENYLGE